MGIFEIVLEVADVERAESFYRALGMDVTDRGDTRRRVRLTAGSFDIELWEPQLGLADGRGGAHVDVGFETDEPQGVLDAIVESEDTDMDTCDVTHLENGIRIRDEDGHHLTFV